MFQKHLDQRGEFVEQKLYEYDGVIHELPDSGGAYVVFPWDIREEFGKGRVKVHAEFRQKRQCVLHNRAFESDPKADEKG